MENKNVGYLILGISVVITSIIFMFNTAMKKIIDSGCNMMHDLGYCPAYGTIDQQTYLSLGITFLLIILGLFLIFTKPNEKIIIKKIKEKYKEKEFNLSNLKTEEKEVFNMIKDSKAIFQADLVEKTGLGKAKMTRILDRLEGFQFIERKRRGMTNIVVLKED